MDSWVQRLNWVSPSTDGLEYQFHARYKHPHQALNASIATTYSELEGSSLNINLIGMRGVGKSNVARRLSVLTKRPVMSTDLLVEYQFGKTIPELISDSGGDWRVFRDAEFIVVQQLAALDGIIVDCGGGVIVDLDEDETEIYSARKLEALRSAGPVVWLQGDIARLAAKTADDPTRPSLHAQKSAEQIMRSRLPFYEEAADFSIFVERGARQAVAQAIAENYSLVENAAAPSQTAVGALVNKDLN